MLTFNSCTKKEVQLPIINIDGIHEIQNHSGIWIFFENKRQDTLAVLNKNNKLINTHWIFNIDKRLTMRQIVPILQKMQEYRNKDSMHKKEGMLNYFSYANVSSNNISLIKFNLTKYIGSEIEYRALLEKLTDNQILEVEIKNNKLHLNHIESSPVELNQKIEEFVKNDSLSKSQIILKYDKNVFSKATYLTPRFYDLATSFHLPARLIKPTILFILIATYLRNRNKS